MIEVSADDLYNAPRFAVLKGGKWSRRQTAGLSNLGGGEVLEYVLPDGEVIARKVVAMGETACWLRADVAEAARAAAAAEAAEHQRVIAEVGAFIKSTDEQGARRNGVSVEQYRAQRHAKGAAWDNYRARQRAGGF